MFPAITYSCYTETQTWLALDPPHALSHVTSTSFSGGGCCPLIVLLEAPSPNSRCRQVSCSLQRLIGRILPCFFPLLVAPGVPWLVIASLQPPPPSASMCVCVPGRTLTAVRNHLPPHPVQSHQDPHPNSSCKKRISK